MGVRPRMRRSLACTSKPPFADLKQDETALIRVSSAPSMMPRTLRHPRHERWLANTPCVPRTEMRAWLTGRGSLTARIRARCTDFEVRVQQQRLGLPLPDERRLIGVRWHASALVREVLLCADGVPVVFAHSVVLPQHLRGAWHLVAGLGTRPLGAVLFADQSVRRGPLRLKLLDPRDRRWQRAVAASGIASSEALWARRSVFKRAGRPILVTEVFLPTLARLFK
ncbi:chorismate lyase [Niveibacterium sp.]|uniref:chorismate--pyruvate lyase family protein n=1 Tax=Niveibacterium sp. TaxID=2017444 RepID=UPI0035B2BF4A